ncbi:restriction endonuclease subunit S [Bacteroides fragilis]|uniref:restriction endonuclease subunit S n=1 Tax=Bacteroides fragilis TaxID=817 RepID=UPI0022AA556F|nr:restriction endonuclease subunit S [Bacteroides fragilis]MCE8975241.1 restriction endonuclease subunit S [Bacteroides fragilis]MCZ2576341.1 restriction endonuclease subunit S [Bacteroides fragilis]
MRFPEFNGEWETKLINDLAVVIGGGTPDTTIKSYWDGEIQWFTPSEIGKNKYVDSSLRTITEEGLNNSSAKLLPPNTILLSSRATIGECSLSLRECATNQGFQSLVSKKCYVDFLYYLIQTKKRDLIRKSCGSTFLEISANEVRKIQVSVPTDVEQQKIAGLLSLIDERIATQNKIIEDLKKLKSAISLKMLHSDSWEQFKIQDIASIGRGRVISSVEISQQENPLYPVYSSQTSNDGIMGYLDDFMFEGEYISWTTDGANAGTVFYRNGKFNCTNVCGLLKLKKGFDAHFVSLVLAEATRMYVSTNLANPKLMNNTMGNIQIRLPKLEEQKRISVVFRKLHGLLETHNSLIIKYSKQKQYLLSQMFI